MSGISVEQLIQHKPHLFGRDPVISGEDGMYRNVMNVNVMEVPDVFNWVRAGDLLLTTAYSIKDNPAAQLALIPRLADKGIAAIGIKTKRYMNTVPEQMIALSNEYRLPILELNYQIGYSQTITEVLEEVLNQKSRWLVDQHQKIQLLTSTLIMGENIKTFIDTFAKCTGLNAAFLTYESEVDTTSAEQHFRLDWPDPGRMQPAKLAPLPDGFRCCWLDGDCSALYMPLQKNRETLAYFVCWGTENTDWEPHLLLLQHTVNLLTLQILKQQSLNNLEDHRKDLFLKTWLLGEIAESSSIALQAASAGLRLQEEYGICITSAISAYSPKEWIQVKTYCIMHGILLLNMGNEWVLFIPKPLCDKADFYHLLQAELRSAAKLAALRLGISRSKRLAQINEGFNEAKNALELWSIVQPEETLCYYDNLGMYPIVQFLTNQDFVKKQLFHYIQPLQDYDKKNQTKLVDTLISYLYNGGNVKETAKMLFCHYNSIVYRLERIESLLQVDLKDPDTRFQLQLAVKVFTFAAQQQSRSFH